MRERQVGKHIFPMKCRRYASAYAIAKICGFSGTIDDFKNLYDQYYSEIIESIPEEKPQPAKAEAVINPMRRKNFTF
jgi:hypothetical protein